ncbi:hypothetical protein ElyMa_006645800 [Elysia marginata]|uniref:Uncharacterized protein n=1 Tax=Elysia marginata TaxID=1093978 RepID=A0AAV4IEK2_9GAST|nr:hypothetical protein ElyMa_006645800 [Elysia marginata]
MAQTGATAIWHRYAALQTTLYKSSINEPRSFAPSTHRHYSEVSRVEIYLHLRPILQTPIAVRGRKQVFWSCAERCFSSVIMDYSSL